jgi:HEAT repeat protein
MNEIETERLTNILVKAIRDLRIGETTSQRAEAARRLGSARSQLAVSYLVESLSDQAPEVRGAAVEALGEIGDPAAIPPLRELLDRETNPLVNPATISNAIDRIRQTEARLSASSSLTEPGNLSGRTIKPSNSSAFPCFENNRGAILKPTIEHRFRKRTPATTTGKSFQRCSRAPAG